MTPNRLAVAAAVLAIAAAAYLIWLRAFTHKLPIGGLVVGPDGHATLIVSAGGVASTAGWVGKAVWIRTAALGRARSTVAKVSPGPLPIVQTLSLETAPGAFPGSAAGPVAVGAGDYVRVLA